MMKLPLNNVIFFTAILITLFTPFAKADVVRNQVAEENPAQRVLNFRVKPVGLAIGIFGAEAQIILFPKINFGVSLDSTATAARSDRQRLLESAILLNYSFAPTAFETGWAIQTRLHRITGDALSASDRGMVGNYFSLVGGHSWFFRDGWNTFLGGGLIAALDTGTRGSEPLLVWQFGWSI